MHRGMPQALRALQRRAELGRRTTKQQVGPTQLSGKFANLQCDEIRRHRGYDANEHEVLIGVICEAVAGTCRVNSDLTCTNAHALFWTRVEEA
jgi:hypothetical protein